ncbi:hypothetical protein DV737_g5599, partial [Chaetothyriales sp. CBS 132003]
MSKSKVIYATTSPYTDPVPEISAPVETDLLQLLLPLLKPLGEFRKRHGSISKGRSRRKRRKAAAAVDAPSKDEVKETDEPERVKIGFNSVVRELEILAGCLGTGLDESEEVSTTDTRQVRLAVVIACPKAMPSPFLNTLPLLVASASMAGGSDQPIRLVGVSSQFETAMSKAVLLPRVGVMALSEDSQGLKTLVNYIRKEVPPVEATWLERARSSSYLPLKLLRVNTPVEHDGARKRKIADDGAE